MCPVNVIAFVNLSAHPLNEDLGGGKWVRKYFYNLNPPQNQGRPIFPVPITINMTTIKETTAVCTS